MRRGGKIRNFGTLVNDTNSYIMGRRSSKKSSSRWANTFKAEEPKFNVTLTTLNLSQHWRRRPPPSDILRKRSPNRLRGRRKDFGYWLFWLLSFGYSGYWTLQMCQGERRAKAREFYRDPSTLATTLWGNLKFRIATPRHFRSLKIPRSSHIHYLCRGHVSSN